MNPEPATRSRATVQTLVSLTALLALSVGGLVLIGWARDIAALKSVLPGWVSMKPNTAVAFILTGIALLARRERPEGGGQGVAVIVSRFCGLLAGLIGLLSLSEYVCGWNLGFDQWLFPEPAGAVGTSHPGRMAPDTALCFVLFAVGWEFARRPRQTTGTALASLLSGAAMTTVALVEILSYFTPALRTYGWGGLTMMALPTATVLVALGAALLLTAWPKNRPQSALPATALAAREARASWMFLLVFLLLTVGIVATGRFYYRQTERQFRAEAEKQFSAIAELKAGELAQYRTERLGHAAIFFNNPSFAALVRRCFAKPADADLQCQLQDWLGTFPTLTDYDRIGLLDAQGVTRLTVPDRLTPPSSAIARGGLEVLRSGQVMFQDFYRSEHDQRVYLAMLVPIRDETDARRPLGVLVLGIDPEKYLYPFIQRWPTPSRTAETLLFRREGNAVVYLNDLRFQTNAALALRLSLTQTNVPAVRAALGQTGIIPGPDYRGVPVIAAALAVPDSPWFLVAKMDVAEVFAPLRAQLGQLVALIGALLFGAGVTVSLVWRQQRVRFYQERAATAAALRETNEYLDNLFRYANAPIVVWDPQLKITRFNRAFEALTGRTAVAVLGQRLDLLFPPALVESSMALIQQAPGGTRWEAVEISIGHRDGSVRTVLWNSAPVFAPDGKTPVATIAQGQDITERKQAEEALGRISRQNELLLQSAGEGLYGLDLAGQTTFANPAAEKMLGYSAAELIGQPQHNLTHHTRPGGTPYPREDCPIYATFHDGHVHHVDTEVFWRKDGTSFPVDYTSTPMRDEHGAVQGAVVVFRDITERKQAEVALRESQTQLGELFNAMEEGFCIVEVLFDPDDRPVDYRFLVCNGAFENQTGLRGAQGKRMLELAPDHEAHWFEIYGRIALTGEARRFENEALALHRYFDVSAYRFGPPEKRQVAILFNDISAQKRIEAALRESEEELRSLAEAMPQIVWVCRPDGRTIYFNRQWVHYTGLTLEESYGHGWNQPFHPDDQRRAWDAWQNATQHDAPYSLECRLRRADGAYRWWLIRAVPSRDGSGKILKWFGTCTDIEDMKQTEAALRESEERFRLAAETANDVVYDWDLKQSVQWFGKIDELLGYARGEFPRTLDAWAAAVHPEDLERTMAAIQAHLEGRSPYSAEYRVRRKDGVHRWWVARGAAARTPEGNPVRLIGSITDITERKQVEVELDRMRNLLEEGQRIAHLGSWEYLAERQETLWSEEQLRIYGLNPAEPSPDYQVMLRHLIHPDDAARLDETFRQCLQDRAVFELEHRLVRPDGSVRVVQELARPYFDDHGRLAKYVGATLDITERKETEAMLQLSEARYRFALEVTSQIGWSTPPDGIVEDMPMWRQYTGQSLEEVVGWKWLDAVHPDDRASAYNAWSNAAAQKISYLTEYRIRRADGVYRNFMVRGIPLLNADGSCKEWVGTCIDITERKAVEEKIRSTLADLERSNQELEQFAYIASHDLQEPLRMVASYTQLLAQRFEGQLDDKGKKYIRYVVDGAFRMQALINDLLAFSRVGTRGGPLEITSALAALEVAQSNLTVAMKEKQARLSHDELPMVVADPSQLGLLFQNLIGNAIKFHREAPPQVHVTARDQGCEWVFAVKDNGIGIEPQHAERVFVIFQRLHTHEEYPGTGIGLAVCKQIVARHGGRIWFESEPGQGTTFFFTIPKQATTTGNKPALPSPQL